MKAVKMHKNKRGRKRNTDKTYFSFLDELRGKVKLDSTIIKYLIPLPVVFIKKPALIADILLNICRNTFSPYYMVLPSDLLQLDMVYSFIDSYGLSYGIKRKGRENADPLLRSYYLCESNAIPIVALSNKLGAHVLDDWEYAENCFEWVKKNVDFRISAVQGALITLKNRYGSCGDNLSLFIALCRAGGIKSRFIASGLSFAPAEEEAWINRGGGVLKDLYDILKYFFIHASAEVYIDGKWVISDPTFTPVYEAGLGMPMAKLGDDIKGWGGRKKKDIFYLSHFPILFSLLMTASIFASRDIVMRINEGIVRDERRGRKILADVKKGKTKRLGKSFRSLEYESDNLIDEMLKEVKK